MATSNAEEVSADAERVRAHPDRGRHGRHVAQALGDVDGVELAEDITGPYDIIAKIQAPTLDQLGRLVVSRIQVVDGVTRTLTCTVIRR
jgi:DNA-binding Lrp family transcriptional regulator